MLSGEGRASGARMRPPIRSAHMTLYMRDEHVGPRGLPFHASCVLSTFVLDRPPCLLRAAVRKVGHSAVRYSSAELNPSTPAAVLCGSPISS